MNLDTYINRIQNLSQNLEKKVYEELKNAENFVLAIPKRRMSLYGTDANDKPITPLYSPATVKRKRKKGKTASHVTLRETGKWKKSFRLMREGKNITFTAPNNAKTGFLVNKYSSNELFGFSPQDGEKIFQIWIKPYINDIIYPDENIDIDF